MSIKNISKACVMVSMSLGMFAAGAENAISFKVVFSPNAFTNIEQKSCFLGIMPVAGQPSINNKSTTISILKMRIRAHLLGGFDKQFGKYLSLDQIEKANDLLQIFCKSNKTVLAEVKKNHLFVFGKD